MKTNSTRKNCVIWASLPPFLIMLVAVTLKFIRSLSSPRNVLPFYEQLVLPLATLYSPKNRGHLPYLLAVLFAFFLSYMWVCILAGRRYGEVSALLIAVAMHIALTYLLNVLVFTWGGVP